MYDGRATDDRNGPSDRLEPITLCSLQRQRRPQRRGGSWIADWETGKWNGSGCCNICCSSGPCLHPSLHITPPPTHIPPPTHFQNVQGGHWLILRSTSASPTSIECVHSRSRVIVPAPFTSPSRSRNHSTCSIDYITRSSGVYAVSSNHTLGASPHDLYDMEKGEGVGKEDKEGGSAELERAGTRAADVGDAKVYRAGRLRYTGLPLEPVTKTGHEGVTLIEPGWEEYPGVVVVVPYTEVIAGVL
ncbi:hypothetical protein FIBSPDRAFT_882540 [Athelia psychrophila]|uniref:Uncharacterized protein n=1 Tax=Athelia psychrophila TaxID=1759441 RepID=A0A166VHI1_9AGAM|nr:hypothetical protein FIBSPDRAFT_882540 [Fibularhizoctonia sp. CBS 109695]